jgi:hypothetical protein
MTPIITHQEVMVVLEGVVEDLKMLSLVTGYLEMVFLVKETMVLLDLILDADPMVVVEGVPLLQDLDKLLDRE